MSEERIGIIGGSGLYDMEGIQYKDRLKLKTPFGDPSDELDVGEYEGREIVFLARHGRGHRFLPTEINYRANIWAMKKLGVEWLISVSAVGSYKKEIKPRDVVLIDQFFDRTNLSRKNTFFGEGIVAHVMFAQPICMELARILFEAGHEAGEGGRIHWGGTYLNMEGPAFSTKAESLIFKNMGFHVIGMTNMSEARLAREAEICYATLAMVTDWDCWNEEDPSSVVSVENIMSNLSKNSEVAQEIIKKAICSMPSERSCGCASALKNAIVTHPGLISAKTLERLDLIIGKYIKV